MLGKGAQVGPIRGAEEWCGRAHSWELRSEHLFSANKTCDVGCIKHHPSNKSSI